MTTNTEGEAFRALINFLLEADMPIAFLRCWNEGSFDICRKKWPEAPDALYPAAPPAPAAVAVPAGEVVYAGLDHATIRWVAQTSATGGGDPSNAYSWPIAGTKVYLTAPAQEHATQLAGQGLTDERISELIQQTEDNSMYGRDHNGWLHSVARTIEREVLAAALPLTINAAMAAAWAQAPCPDIDGMNDDEANFAHAQANWSAMLAAAPAQAQEDARDAARWRFLREEHEGEAESLCVFGPNDMRECLVPIGSLPGELDAFIDAARAAQGGAA